MADDHFDPRSESEEDIIEYMKWKKDEPTIARAAYGEFYARHKRYMFVVCCNAFGEDIGSATVEDIVQETFWRAFEKIESFDTEGSGDNDGLRRRIRAWLGRIAYRLFLSHARTEKQRFSLVTGQDDRVAQCEARPSTFPKLTQEENLVQRAMGEVLTQSERTVLESFASHYDPECKYNKSPPGVVDGLCDQLETTAENVRQIRKRAIKKLREFVTEATGTVNTEKDGSHDPQRGQQPKTARRR